jgi:ribonuclease HI
MSLTKSVEIYTDGACSGNPGPGGFGFVLFYKKHRKESSGGFRWTTNNRMELMGLIIALTALKEPCSLTIHTDSQYLMGAFAKDWITKWKKNGWKTSSKKDVQNQDLWRRLDALLQAHQFSFKWIKGHADDLQNNRCDQLAVEASHKKATDVDAEYEGIKPFPATSALASLVKNSI